LWKWERTGGREDGRTGRGEEGKRGRGEVEDAGSLVSEEIFRNFKLIRFVISSTFFVFFVVNFLARQARKV